MATDVGGYGPGELVQRLPVWAGAVSGVVTHVAGLLMTFLLLVVDPEFEFGASRIVRVGTVDETGWLFFGAHFARIEQTVPFGVGGAEGGTERLDILAETTLWFPAVAVHAVPVVVLIAGGFVLVSGRELWESTLKAHALAGATVTAGYFPLAAVGVFVFETRLQMEDATVGGTEFVIAPELSSTLLLVGLVYPLLFGAVGGLLASQFQPG